MAEYGFYFDADNCIGCRTCQVACKNAHDLPVGVNYRVVRTFVTGSGWEPRIYHLSLPVQGCDLCQGAIGTNEFKACVASCPQRVLEWGSLDELRAAHEGEELVEEVAAVKAADMTGPASVMRIKPCMLDADFDEVII